VGQAYILASPKRTEEGALLASRYSSDKLPEGNARAKPRTDDAAGAEAEKPEPASPE